MKKLLIIFGTRPEAIKMAPLVLAMKNNVNFDVKVCVTAQHRQMLDQVLDFFQIIPDFDLNLMQKNQSLEELTSRIILGLSNVLREWRPDHVLVHGDTTSCMASSLAAFYQKISVCHVEAGLRTNNLYSPFPEEMNRVLTARLAEYHFSPTIEAKENLLREGVSSKKIFVVGNTVIDALQLGLSKVQKSDDLEILNLKTLIEDKKSSPMSKIILVTGHRRENFGEGLKNICSALKELAIKFPQNLIIYPVHLNPNVSATVFSLLKDFKNILLIDPLDYKLFLWLMSEAYLIITDSGGIQEEAPSLGKPVLVTRETTERPEALKTGAIILTGACKERIVQAATQILTDDKYYLSFSKKSNPYGDGKASMRIVNILEGKSIHEFLS